MNSTKFFDELKAEGDFSDCCLHKADEYSFAIFKQFTLFKAEYEVITENKLKIFLSIIFKKKKNVN